MPYSVTLIGGLHPNDRRGLAFLECNDDTRIDAKMVFDGLSQKTKWTLLNRFDYWLSDKPCDNYYHGWPNDTRYKECFVFKWKKGRVHHRLYGFLINPKPLAPRFRACVLVSHTHKNEEHTDQAHLDRANALRLNPAVIEAVKRAFAGG